MPGFVISISNLEAIKMFKYQYQRRCPERTDGALVCYGETITDNVLTVSAIRHRLAYMVSIFPGTMWRDGGHEGRMESVRYFSGFDPCYGMNAYYAAVYLLTSDIDLYRRTMNCYTPTGICFDRARRRDISIQNYDLLGAAKTIYYGVPDLTLDDLANYEIIDTETFQLIANALLIVRYGPEILQIVRRRSYA